MSKYLEMAFAIQDEIAEIRRDVHRHPEVGNTEERTSRLVRDKLAEYGVDTIESPTPTSVVATVRGNKGAGGCIALAEGANMPCTIEAVELLHAAGIPGEPGDDPKLKVR